MSLAEYVQVEVEGLRLTRAVIRNGWQEHGTPVELASALTTAIHAQLPPAPGFEDHPGTAVRADFSMSDLEAFMDLHHRWRAKLREFKARVAAGEFDDDLPAEVMDQQERASVSFIGDRFEALHFNPTWAASASLQAISDTVVKLLGDIDLVRNSARAAAFAEVRALSAAAHRYAS